MTKLECQSASKHHNKARAVSSKLDRTEKGVRSHLCARRRRHTRLAHTNEKTRHTPDRLRLLVEPNNPQPTTQIIWGPANSYMYPLIPRKCAWSPPLPEPATGYTAGGRQCELPCTGQPCPCCAHPAVHSQQQSTENHGDVLFHRSPRRGACAGSLQREAQQHYYS